MDNYVKLAVGRIQRIMAEEGTYENVSDIIADIMHYCDWDSIPFDVALNVAQNYYDSDIEETVVEDDGA